MHGRAKVKSSAEQEEAKKQSREEKVKVYKRVTNLIYTKRAAGDHDDEALKLTRSILTVNPEITTLWNYRREILLDRFKTISAQEATTACEAELNLLEACLKVNPKAYCIWLHRQWVMEGSPCPDWMNEKKLCDMFLKYDERNFHCWDYRRYVISKSPDITPQDELDFTYKKIAANFSNYSAWHYRSKLLPKLHPSPNKPGGVAEEALLKEHELVQNAFFTDPSDQSAWFYQRWLLGKVDKPLAVSCVLVREAAHPELLVTFNQPVKISEERPLEIVAGSTSLTVLSDNDWPQAVYRCSFLDGGVGKEGKVVVRYGDLEVEVNIQGEGDSIYLADLKDMFSSTLTEATSDVLVSELTSCQELLELEPDNKWCILTVVSLMQAVDAGKYASEITDLLGKLRSVDSYREGYYQDLLSKFVIEQALKEKFKGFSTSDRVLSLANKGLSRLYFPEYLQVFTSIDLSGNSLCQLPAEVRYLVSVRELILDGNQLERLPEEMDQLYALEVLSIKNNRISEASALGCLKKITSLRRIELNGNPLCELQEDCLNLLTSFSKIIELVL